ncbi:MAG: KUP/HAK/KT family potassium transporter [Solirubrobacterales bacterium]|nr:KUP/HAK/KT family potassium transporter [Solirubrobacterales bacterium]
MPSRGASSAVPRERGTTSAAAPTAGRGLALAALGVVFGDIGTSPLYALQTVFTIDNGAVRPDSGDVLGAISLVVWAVTVVVSVKYVAFVLRADNEGEGGIMALVALVRRVRGHTAALAALGVFGAALFYGDSIITPAISVLAAVEGLEIAAPGVSHLVVPIALAILAALFAIQRRGTRTVGRLFGPVMLLWFVAIAMAGLLQVVKEPSVLRGLSPSYAGAFMLDRPGVAFVAMGAVVLAVTGAEALYADLGHFGRTPIRRAWFALVFPALTLNYLGQAALILNGPAASANPFYLMLPHWSRIPMVVLATVATVIASQAVISGAFSLSRQAMALGLLPGLLVRHTSEREAGQVYVPAVNRLLFVAVGVVVVGFASSARLASAYGVAVSGTFVISTLLFLAVARRRWHWSSRQLVPAAVGFLSLEITFLAANLGKVVHGGWLPLGVAAAIFTIMTTWRRGRAIVSANRTAMEGPLRPFVEELRSRPVLRVPGAAIYPSPSIRTTPLAMRAAVEHTHVLHESVVIVTAEFADVPRIAPDERVRIDDLGHGDDGIAHVTARFGFAETPNLPEALRNAVDRGLERTVDVDSCVWYVSRVSIVVTEEPGMARWRKRLFAALSKAAASPADHFGLPGERTLTVSSQVHL